MKFVRAFWMLAIAMAASSCLDLTFHTMVKENGSGTINVEVLLDQSIAAMYLQSREDGEQDFHSDLHGVKITKNEEGYDKDGRYFIRMQGQFDRFNGLSEEDLVYKMERGGNQTVYEINFVSERPAGESPDEERDAEMAEQMLKMMFGDRQVRYQLSVPGKIIKHNSDRVDGQTLTWNMPYRWIKTGLRMDVTCSN